MPTTTYYNAISNPLQLGQYIQDFWNSIAGLTPANAIDQTITTFNDGIKQGLSFWRSTGSIPFNSNTEQRVWMMEAPNGGGVTTSTMAAGLQATSPITYNNLAPPNPSETPNPQYPQWLTYIQSASDKAFSLYCGATRLATMYAPVVVGAGEAALGAWAGLYGTAASIAATTWYNYEVNRSGATGPVLQTANAQQPNMPTAPAAQIDVSGIVNALNQIATQEPVVSFNHGGAVFSFRS